MERAPILEDSQSPSRGLLRDAVVEDDDAVRDVLFDAVTSERPIAPLARDHGGDAPILEPGEQAAQFGAQYGRVRERSEEGLDCVDDDSFGTDRVDRRAEPKKQSLEIPVPSLFDLSRKYVDVVDHELTVRLELRQIETHRRDVGDEVAGGLLECHEHPRFAELGDPTDEELHREERLAATSRATDERRSPAGQTAPRHLVESADTGRRLWQLRQSGSRSALRVQLTDLVAVGGCHSLSPCFRGRRAEMGRRSCGRASQTTCLSETGDRGGSFTLPLKVGC